MTEGPIPTMDIQPSQGDLLQRWRVLEETRDSMPEYRVVRRIQAIGYASEVLEQNRKTLETTIREISASQMRSLTFESVACIHNYSSSLYSFRKAIDAVVSPAIRRQLLGVSDMKSTVDATFLDEATAFLLVLRDCCQHYRMPVEYTLTSGHIGDPRAPEKRLALMAGPLSVYAATESRSGKDYLAGAMRYLADKGLDGLGAIDLWAAVFPVHRMLDELRDSLRKWVALAYKSELDAVRSANQSVEYAELAWRLDVSTPEQIGYPGRLVGEYLSSEDARRLCSVDALLGDPAAVAVDMLNTIHPVDEVLQSAITRSFDLWVARTGRDSTRTD